METNTLSYEHDALVIGAGFAGIAAATQLAALGRKVKVWNGTTIQAGARVFFMSKDSPSTWARVGIGCQMFSKPTLPNL